MSCQARRNQEECAIREDWTRVLRRGEEAIRERLARGQAPRGGEPAPDATPAAKPQPSPPVEVQAPVGESLPVETASDLASAPEAIIAPEAPAAPTAAAPEPVPPPPQPADRQPAVAPPLPHLFAQLTTGDRIVQPLLYRDRTFLIALGILAFMSLSGVVATINLDDEPPPQAQEQERRGQVEKSETVTVELVEEPDAQSKSKLSQMGENAPVAPPTPPAPQQQPTPPAPPDAEDKPAEPEKQQQAKAEKPEQKPLTVDDFDVSMADYAKAIDRAEAERKQRKAQQQTAQASRLAGAAPQGQQSAYVKSVLAIVAQNKPQMYLNKGEVYVQFILNLTGQIAAIKVVETSGDPLLDQIALNALKVLKFPAPPPNVNPNDLNYVIHYVLH